MLDELTGTIGRMKTYSKNVLHVDNAITSIELDSKAYDLFVKEVNDNCYCSRELKTDTLMGVRITRKENK